MIGAAVVVLIVLSVGGFFLFGGKKEEEMEYKKKKTNVATNPTPMKAMKVAAMKVKKVAVMKVIKVKEYTLTVTEARKRKIKVMVTVGDAKPIEKMTPFDLKVKEKSKVSLPHLLKATGKLRNSPWRVTKNLF